MRLPQLKTYCYQKAILERLPAALSMTRAAAVKPKTEVTQLDEP